MKIRALLASLVLALMLCVSTSAQTATVPAQTVEEFHKDLAKATLALYERHPHTQADDFYGFNISTGKTELKSLREMVSRKQASNPFVSSFTCTATIIEKIDSTWDHSHDYKLLTAGHCFGSLNPDSKYYVSEGIDTDPTLQRVTVLKFANTNKYDYALLELHSKHDYPVIKVSLGELPKVETPLVNMNFSLGLTQQLVKGQIVSTGVLRRGESEPGMEYRFMTSLGVGPGASGSAVVDENSREIVGLVEAIFPGFSVGTVAVPMGKGYDNFLIDDAVTEKAPREIKVAPPLPRVEEESDLQIFAKGIVAFIAALLITLLITFLIYKAFRRRTNASKQAAPRAS